MGMGVQAPGAPPKKKKEKKAFQKVAEAILSSDSEDETEECESEDETPLPIKRDPAKKK